MVATDLVQNKIPAGKPAINTYTSLAKSDFTEWTDAIRIGAHAFPHTYVCMYVRILTYTRLSD
jgi:hypothetical protein